MTIWVGQGNYGEQHNMTIWSDKCRPGFELSPCTSQIAKYIPITVIEMFHATWKMWSSFFILKSHKKIRRMNSVPVIIYMITNSFEVLTHCTCSSLHMSIYEPSCTYLLTSLWFSVTSKFRNKCWSWEKKQTISRYWCL